MILGQTWLQPNRATIIYEKYALTYLYRGIRQTIRCGKQLDTERSCEKLRDEPRGAQASVLNAHQMRLEKPQSPKI